MLSFNGFNRRSNEGHVPPWRIFLGPLARLGSLGSGPSVVGHWSWAHMGAGRNIPVTAGSPRLAVYFLSFMNIKFFEHLYLHTYFCLET